MYLSGHHILITGGTSGIGAALAAALHKHSNQVGICGRRSERLRHMEARLPVKTLVCHLSQDKGPRALLHWAQQEMPLLNVLVNNAGIQRDIDFTEGLGEYLSGEVEIRVNLQSPIELTGLFATFLRQNSNPIIIDVSSGLGFVPMGRPCRCTAPPKRPCMPSLWQCAGSSRKSASVYSRLVHPPLILSSTLTAVQGAAISE